MQIVVPLRATLMQADFFRKLWKAVPRQNKELVPPAVTRIFTALQGVFSARCKRISDGLMIRVNSCPFTVVR
jgi:hypothetical protein